MKTIGITGSAGLIGTALLLRLRDRGYRVVPFDLHIPAAHAGHGDVLDRRRVQRLADACDGIVHLAAVSRVILGERDPQLCWATNVLGTQRVLDAALAASHRPWVIFASSREVYGQAQALPVAEDAPLCPVNVYGRSKVEAEHRVIEARARGLRTAILRFSNVYGSTHDHADRVVPAFARAAARGTTLRVDGSQHLFDFTHLSDTVAAILATLLRVEQGEALPPIHILTGRGTTLGDLAALAIAAGGKRSGYIEAPARSYDVARFVGDPTRAKQRLGFCASVSIAQGVARLVQAFADSAHSTAIETGL